MRPLLIESVLLAPAGGGAGLLLAMGGVRLLHGLALTALPSYDAAQTGVTDESRSAGRVAVGVWITPALQPDVGLEFERWSGGSENLDMSAGAEFRAAGDRLVIATNGESGQAPTIPLGSGAIFGGSGRRRSDSAAACGRHNWAST